MVVNIITLVTMMLTSMAIVREKEIGTMEQLMVTPIRPDRADARKDAAIRCWSACSNGAGGDRAPGCCSTFRCAAASCSCCVRALFLMTTLGAGLFISTVSRTQQQAMMSMFLFFQPFFLLSGFAFPIRNMPAAVQYLTYLNPVRYFLEIVRGIFLKGSGPAVLWPQMVALGVFGAAILGASALRFHKKLE